MRASADRLAPGMKSSASAKSPILIRPAPKALIVDGTIRIALLALLIFGVLTIRHKFNNLTLFAAILAPALLITMPFVVTVILLVKERKDIDRKV